MAREAYRTDFSNTSEKSCDSSTDIVILSLDQILNTSERTVEALAEIVAAREANGCCRSAKGTVKSAIFWDEMPFIGSGIIESLRKGEITTKEFHEKLDKKLGITTTPADFCNAWFAMHEISSKDAERIQALLNLRDERGFKLVVVSATSEQEHDYIQGQLAHFDITLSFISSHAHGTTNQSVLAAVPLPLQYQNGDRIISLDKNVTKIPEYKITCRPFDSSKENLLDVLMEVTRNDRVVPFTRHDTQTGMRDFCDDFAREEVMRSSALSPNPAYVSSPGHLSDLLIETPVSPSYFAPALHGSQKSSLEERRQAPSHTYLDCVRIEYPIDEGAIDFSKMVREKERETSEKLPFQERAGVLESRCQNWVDEVAAKRENFPSRAY